MDYINYTSLLDVDSTILSKPEYHTFREKYRLFRSVGRYLNSAIRQYNRIENQFEEHCRLGSRTTSETETIELELLFSDLHFLLICMDKCYKYEQELYQNLNLSSVAEKIYISESATTVRKMRNILEHANENINKTAQNINYNLPPVYIENGWSWLEYQSLSINNGIFRLKNEKLSLSDDMLSDIIKNYNSLINILNKEYINLQ